MKQNSKKQNLVHIESNNPALLRLGILSVSVISEPFKTALRDSTRFLQPGYLNLNVSTPYDLSGKSQVRINEFLREMDIKAIQTASISGLMYLFSGADGKYNTQAVLGGPVTSGWVTETTFRRGRMVMSARQDSHGVDSISMEICGVHEEEPQERYFGFLRSALTLFLNSSHE